MTLRAFTMPKWGIEMVEGTLAEWRLPEGAAFRRGDLLALVETDKITNEVEADSDGVLARRVATEGERLPVGALLAVLADGPATPEAIDAFIAGFRPAAGSQAAEAAEAAGPGGAGSAGGAAEAGPGPAGGPGAGADSATATATPAAPPIPPDVRLSPAARAHVLAHGLDVAGIAGSGRGGRITLQDAVQASRREARPALAGPLPLPPEAGPPATPLARRLAAAHGLSLDGVTGTGSRGRIGRADVEALLAARAAAAGGTAVAAATDGPAGTPADAAAAGAAAGSRVASGVATGVASGAAPGGSAAHGRPAPADNLPRIVPMTSLQRAAARRLAQAKASIPHFYLRTAVAVDELERLRQAASLLSGTRISLTDCLLRACALALVRTPGVNIQVHGEEVHFFPHADIALAVATERGLVAPVLRGADRLGLVALAAEARALAERARAGRLQAADLEGGTFTISNLGMLGVDQFDAIINPPHGAILAVGAARRVPAERPDGGCAFETRVALSLSCDHRAIDGATAARFLAALRALVEAPAALFAPAA